MSEQQNLAHDLAVAIDVWIKKGADRNLSSLAKESKVAYSTLRRITQKASIPNPDSALAVSEIVMCPIERIAFFRKHFPIVASVLDKCDNNPLLAHKEQLPRFLYKDVHDKVFRLSTDLTGTSRREIRRLTGDLGIRALDQMIHQGLLQETKKGEVTIS